MISFQELCSCVGLAVNSPEVANLFSHCLDNSVVSFDSVLSKTYTSYESGCEVRCYKDPERVCSIFLYDNVQIGNDKEVFARYSQQLPPGIIFSDTPDMIKQKLGIPDETGSDRLHSASFAEETLYFDWLRYHQDDDNLIRFCFIKGPKLRLFRIDIQRA